jgi:signal transduction histidine kinase
MPRRSPPTLQARLDEAEATLEAIRTGAVDALVVSGPGGDRTLAIEGAVHPYHTLLDAMTDGAALIAEDGTLLFGNRRLAELLGRSLSLGGAGQFLDLVAPASRATFATLLGGPGGPGGPGGAGEFLLVSGTDVTTPVWISLSTVPLDGGTGPRGPLVRMAIITDLSERKRAEATRLDLMRRLLSVEDEERRRIARELHDETGQSLTALLVGLKVIEQRTERTDVREAAERLRAVAAQTVDNVGRLARGLHPSVLDDLGLLAAARRYVADYAKGHGLEVDFRSEGLGTRRLPSLIQTTMYRILQEGLTNVARHSRATRVELELRLDGGGLELQIRDDGVGFDPATAEAARTGLGLHGMGERAALLGGTIEIRSAPGQGTTVHARVPASPEPAEERA